MSTPSNQNSLLVLTLRRIPPRDFIPLKALSYIQRRLTYMCLFHPCDLGYLQPGAT